MRFEFYRWQKNFDRLAQDLRGVFEEEFQAVVLSKISVEMSALNDIQDRKMKLLRDYEAAVTQGTLFADLLSALPQKQKEMWLKDVEDIHVLGERNLKMIQRSIKEREKNLANFQKWLQRPSQGPYTSLYASHKEIDLGLDRRI